MRQRSVKNSIRRLAALLFALLLAASFLPPLTAHAQSGEKVVRVGWHEEPYFITDQYGRRSGYSYEYQCKLAAYTGVDMDCCFALRKGDTELYSILARVSGAVPDAVVHTALTYYSTEDVKTSFTDLIRDNLFIVMSVIAGVLLVIVILLLRSIRADKIMYLNKRGGKTAG